MVGNGSTEEEGYVEVLVNGVWRSVCNDNFDTSEAQVICKMLGFPRVVEASANGIVPSGNGFVLNDLECDGTEESVFKIKSFLESSLIN